MSDNAFSPQTPCFNITTNATAGNPSSQAVSFASPASAQPTAQATGLTFPPPQYRVVNNSTGTVYLSITNVARTAAAPTPTQPSLEQPIGAGASATLTLQQYPLTNGTGQLFINTIAATAAAVINLTFGEGR